MTIVVRLRHVLDAVAYGSRNTRPRAQKALVGCVNVLLVIEIQNTSRTIHQA